MPSEVSVSHGKQVKHLYCFHFPTGGDAELTTVQSEQQLTPHLSTPTPTHTQQFHLKHILYMLMLCVGGLKYPSTSQIPGDFFDQSQLLTL